MTCFCLVQLDTDSITFAIVFLLLDSSSTATRESGIAVGTQNLVHKCSIGIRSRMYDGHSVYTLKLTSVI